MRLRILKLEIQNATGVQYYLNVRNTWELCCKICTEYDNTTENDATVEANTLSNMFNTYLHAINEVLPVE
jgi:hypothetical protein